MSRGSAFARVIGLTRSLSPFEKAEADTASGTAPAPAGDEAPVPGDEAPADEAALPALAQVTVVAAETPAVAVDDVRQAVAREAIDAIEADIASLLSSLDTTGALPRQVPGDDGDAAPALQRDEEDATLALLFELDRMWRSDPMVAAGFR